MSRGFTQASDFPTTPNAYDRTMGGSGDAFVSRFDPTGRVLNYSTFLGGTAFGTDEGVAIASAGPGVVVLAGDAHSHNFPTTPGAYDRTFNGGGWDVFVSTLRLTTTMHVERIDPRYRPNGSGYDVGAQITILAWDGTPVRGAMVEVELDYPSGRTVELTGKTDSNGLVIVGRHVTATGTYTFTVLTVGRPPLAYDPSSNVETSGSVTIP